MTITLVGVVGSFDIANVDVVGGTHSVGDFLDVISCGFTFCVAFILSELLFCVFIYYLIQFKNKLIKEYGNSCDLEPRAKTTIK